MPQQQLAQAFKTARRQEAKQAAARLGAPAAQPDTAAQAGTDASTGAAAPAAASSTAGPAGASAVVGSSSNNGAPALPPLQLPSQPLDIINGSESSSGCDSSDDDGEDLDSVFEGYAACFIC